MKWTIPAKTFLLGEYAAIAGDSAIILTTSPHFELSFNKEAGLENISKLSPAGQYWLRYFSSQEGLKWKDPFQKGGLGASSAQFIAVYLAECYLSGVKPTLSNLIDHYYQFAWSGKGLKPSAYDVLAQTQRGCVYINRNQNKMQCYGWPFESLSFILLHSGEKLATHTHLQSTSLPSINTLSPIVEEAKLAIEQVNNEKLLKAISAYQQQLISLNLISATSQQRVKYLAEAPEVLAAKGCGALGTDVFLIIVLKDNLKLKVKSLALEGWDIVATSDDLYKGSALIKNNPYKTLEILP